MIKKRGPIMTQKKYFSIKVFRQGIKDGIPIGLGYFAVAFSLGIQVKASGMSPMQGFLMSLLCNASAGEYAGLITIAANAAYIEMAFVTLITNARYLLMSCALSQRLEPDLPWYHRLILGNYVTDELFGISIARPGYLNPYYTYGAVIIASPCWALGTALGAIAGAGLPSNVVSALSVALYGMFLAVIIPPSRKNKVICAVVLISFAASWLFSYLPFTKSLSGGTRTIILTIVIGTATAVFFPVKEEQNDA